MSQPGDPLPPLPEEPKKSRLSRTPYIALGVALVVVSTVFATVASLTAARDEATPPPENRNAVEETTPETFSSDPTSTSVAPTSGPASSSTAPTTSSKTSKKKPTSTKPGDPPPPNPPPPGPTTPTGPTTTPPPPNQPPNVRMGGGCPETGFTCSFTGSGSRDPDGSIVSYEWSFGDGSGGSSADPSHTYSAAGTYQVTLTVTDDDGARRSTGGSVTVTAPPTSR